VDSGTIKEKGKVNLADAEESGKTYRYAGSLFFKEVRQAVKKKEQVELTRDGPLLRFCESRMELERVMPPWRCSLANSCTYILPFT